jgi:hypothetical protein
MSTKHTIGRALIAGLLVALGAAIAAAQAPTPATDSVNPEAPPAVAAPTPVRLRDHILFEVNTPIGTLTPMQRAAAIEQRLMSAAEGPASTIATLRTAESDGFTGIYAGPVLIRAVTDGDAAHTGRTRAQLAADQLLLIKHALAVEYRERGTAHVLRGLLLATGATVSLVALLIGLRWGYRWTRAKISRVALAWHWQSSLARLKLLSPSSVANASRSFAAGLAWLMVLLLVSFCRRGDSRIAWWWQQSMQSSKYSPRFSAIYPVYSISSSSWSSHASFSKRSEACLSRSQPID